MLNKKPLTREELLLEERQQFLNKLKAAMAGSVAIRWVRQHHACKACKRGLQHALRGHMHMAAPAPP